MVVKEIEHKICPRCQGRGEIMHRVFAIDSDESEDIGNTPHPITCPRCNGIGEVKNVRKKN